MGVVAAGVPSVQAGKLQPLDFPRAKPDLQRPIPGLDENHTRKKCKAVEEKAKAAVVEAVYIYICTSVGPYDIDVTVMTGVVAAGVPSVQAGKLQPQDYPGVKPVSNARCPIR